MLSCGDFDFLEVLEFHLVHGYSLYFLTISTEAPLFGGLYAAVLLCLCPEVSPLLPNICVYWIYLCYLTAVFDLINLTF